MRNETRIRNAETVKAAFPHIEKSESLFKTPCTSAILGFFGIGKNQFRFSQTLEDMQRIFRRNGWSMRKERRALPLTVGNLPLAGLPSGFYVVSVPLHVFLVFITERGEVKNYLDTAPSEEKIDSRELESVWRIRRK